MDKSKAVKSLKDGEEKTAPNLPKNPKGLNQGKKDAKLMKKGQKSPPVPKQKGVNEKKDTPSDSRESTSQVANRPDEQSEIHNAEGQGSFMQALIAENKKMLEGMLKTMKDEFSAAVEVFDNADTPRLSNDNNGSASSGKHDSLGSPQADPEVKEKDSGQNSPQDDVPLDHDKDLHLSSVDDNDLSDGFSLADTEVTDITKDVRWASVLKQLPSYMDGKLTLEEDGSQDHTSFMSDTFQSDRKNPIPKLPLDGLVKQKWDEVEKFIKSGKISCYRSSDNRKFRINEADFEKYGHTPKIDPEFKAKLKLDATPKFGKANLAAAKGEIKNPVLRVAELELMKCDESARLALKASSHGALLLNGMNSIISNPEKYQQEELLKLMHGVFDCLQTVTDIAVRVTARSVMARRRICLSQISFKDNNASRELMSLPMSGNLLFQGQLTDIMHKYATFSRDARETSDYASAAGSKGQKRRHGPGDGSTQVSKKLAVTKPAQGPNKGKKPFSFKKPAPSTATKPDGAKTSGFRFRKKPPASGGPRFGQHY